METERKSKDTCKTQFSQNYTHTHTHKLVRNRIVSILDVSPINLLYLISSVVLDSFTLIQDKL